MFSRSIGRAVIESPWQASPRFLLPLRARLHTTQQLIERDPPPSTPSLDTKATSSPTESAKASEGIVNPLKQQISRRRRTPTSLAASSSSDKAPKATADSPPAPLSETVKQLLPALAQQTPHYATVHIHSRAYMITEGDHVLLPFHMPNVNPGDILRLNRASLLGSRDYTLNGQPYVDDRVFECRAVVMGVEAEPMRYKEKTKRRNRKIKTVKSKHRYTKIAIKELRVKDLSDI